MPDTTPTAGPPAPTPDKHHAQPELAAATVLATLDDVAAKIVAVDDAFATLTGVSRTQALDWTLADLLATALGDRRDAARTIHTLGRGEAVEHAVPSGRLAPGAEALFVRLVPVELGERGRPTHALCTFARTDAGTAGARVNPEPLDALTGLPTRAQLLSWLDVACAAATADWRVAVLFVDVDHFKLINDSLGHAAGDRVLVEVARRLASCTRPGDRIARFGGDEFVVALEDVTPERAADVAERVVSTLGLPVEMEGREIALSASVGFAVSGPETREPEQLLRNADRALYEAKAAGRARAKAFDRDIHQRAVRRLEVEAEIRRALRDREFTLHYQPQIDLHSGTLVGAEALLRWRHPQLGMVPPAEFVPIAEQSGLIRPLGRWVIDEACRQLGEWNSLETAPRSVTINVSPLQLGDSSVVSDVRDALTQSGVDPSSVCLELTESGLMQTAGQTIDTLQQLRSLGVYLSIDDFGTGFSSLARLRDLPVEVLKIDRSFVDGLGRESDDSAIVASIMSLAFAMGLHAIAEGVEDPLQASALARLGCTTVQGYLYSPPVDSATIVGLCRTTPWRSAATKASAKPVRWGISRVHGRPGRRQFIDEFLDQIGVHMHVVEGRTQ